ncbi:hypothetical protein AUK11_03880 [bacterium CG2_30_37_16]|nr:MAG: hypothetical protein AUK11_03880 [bacterium CG2_30_37_16]PIP30305.1 MAG: hypothetical protein COX25_05420 [bacterium (Candidatus Howlettbacteria) CG23_combo_of_CG06-09_8_20_14_all_37_9]PIX98658.1 MAG: hypothetical protein COZ22_04460 [bacterium (Candidatus Howlettbacteria) CG_4_10_14_3_um_filter_37_10]PJB07284.1 MAG: hypothetical protein CO123_00395 [bacterium (Candidatus Howlettbacteria) CG_4_9_14_3_um_filter_37_10]
MKKENGKKEITTTDLANSIDDLAMMVAKGFGEMGERFDQVDQEFRHVNNRLDKVEDRLCVVEFEITHLAHSSELQALKQRVEILEKKISR